MAFGRTPTFADEYLVQRRRELAGRGGRRGVAHRSASDIDVLDRIEKRIAPNGLKVERLAFETQWLAALNYFSGRQHYGIIDHTFVDSDPAEDGHERYYKANFSKLHIVRAISKVDGVTPSYAVAPASESLRSREIAAISERVRKHQLEVMGFDETWPLIGLWSAICGSGFGKVWWDGTKGAPERVYVQDRKDRRPMPPELLSDDEKRTLDAAGLFEDYYPGEIQLSVPSPFGAYHDWSATDGGIKQCQWFADAQYMDIERVADRWGIDPSDLVPDEGTRGLMNYIEAVKFMNASVGSNPLAYVVPMDKVASVCLYVDMYDRPSRRWPNGRRTVFGGGRVLYDGDNPYIGDQTGWSHLPYFKRDWVRHPGRFWGTSLMEDLMSPQFNTNRMRELLLSFAEVHGNAPTFIDPDANVDTDNMSTRAGAIIQAKLPNQNIKVGTSPSMPAEVAGMLNVTESDMNKIASQSEIDGSKLPSQMRSGAAIRQMLNERSVGLNLPIKASQAAVRDLGRISLGIGKVYYNTPRIMRYLGDTGHEFVVETFSAADLNNDVRIVDAALIEDSPDAKRQDMLDSVAAGALDPLQNPEDRMLFLSAMRFGTYDEVLAVKLQAKRNQEREIELMKRDPERYGVTYPIAEFEDHATEARVLVAYMYSAEFKTLPPQVQAVIMRHWKLHTMALDAARQQAMAEMEATKGAPGQKGKASAPKR